MWFLVCVFFCESLNISFEKNNLNIHYINTVSLQYVFLCVFLNQYFGWMTWNIDYKHKVFHLYVSWCEYLKLQYSRNTLAINCWNMVFHLYAFSYFILKHLFWIMIFDIEDIDNSFHLCVFLGDFLIRYWK